MKRKKIPNLIKNIVIGCHITWSEAVFEGDYLKETKYIGDRINEGLVIKESYGDKKAQHTFTIEIIKSEGIQPIEISKKIRRKGRNLYKGLLVNNIPNDIDEKTKDKNKRSNDAKIKAGKIKK